MQQTAGRRSCFKARATASFKKKNMESGLVINNFQNDRSMISDYINKRTHTMARKRHVKHNMARKRQMTNSIHMEHIHKHENIDIGDTNNCTYGVSCRGESDYLMGEARRLLKNKRNKKREKDRDEARKLLKKRKDQNKKKRNREGGNTS